MILTAWNTNEGTTTTEKRLLLAKIDKRNDFAIAKSEETHPCAVPHGAQSLLIGGVLSTVVVLRFEPRSFGWNFRPQTLLSIKHIRPLMLCTNFRHVFACWK